jgi:hypothetical protein
VAEHDLGPVLGELAEVSVVELGDVTIEEAERTAIATAADVPDGQFAADHPLGLPE